VFDLFRRAWGGLADRFQGKPTAGQLMLWVLRGVFGAIVISMAMLAFQHVSVATEDSVTAWTGFFSILGLGALLVMTDVLIRDKQITTISAVYFGLLLGLLLGNILSTALEPFLFEWERDPTLNARLQQRKALVALLITVACCYITISTLLQTKD
jgi:uncharacterized protein YacL